MNQNSGAQSTDGFATMGATSKKKAKQDKAGDAEEGGGAKTSKTKDKSRDKSSRKYNYKIQLPVMSTFNILPEGFRPDLIKEQIQQKMMMQSGTHTIPAANSFGDENFAHQLSNGSPINSNHMHRQSP